MLSNADGGLESLRHLLERLARQLKEVESLNDVYNDGPFNIITVDLKQTLIPHVMQSLEKLNCLIPSMAAGKISQRHRLILYLFDSELLQQLGDNLHMAGSGLTASDTNAAEYVSKLRHLEAVESREDEYLSRYNEIQDLYALIDQHELAVSELDRASFMNLANEFKSMEAAIEGVRASKQERITHYKAELETGTLMVDISALSVFL